MQLTVSKHLGLIILLLALWATIYFAQSIAVTGQFTDTKPGMFLTLTHSVTLKDSPVSSLYIPSNLYNVKFGQITFKNETFDVVIGLKNGKETLLIDGNRNKNLSDDIIYSQTSPITDTSIYIARLTFNDGSYYYIALWRIKDELYYCGITRKEGWLYSGDKKYKAAVAETDSDGWYTKGNILFMIDLNENGKFDGPEFFRKYVKIESEYYTIKSITRNGESIILEKNATSVLVPFVGEQFPNILLKDINNKEVDLSKPIGQWKVIYFNFLSASEIPQIKNWLNTLSNFSKEEMKIYALFGVSSCEYSPSKKCPKIEELENEYENITIIPINNKDLDELTIRLRLLYPETIMLVSPSNTLVYRTPAGVVTEEAIWKYTITMPTIEQFSHLIETLDKN